LGRVGSILFNDLCNEGVLGAALRKATIPCKTTGKKALKELLSAEQIKRIGIGVRGDPFRYFTAG
jgi:hypothetical protein